MANQQQPPQQEPRKAQPGREDQQGQPGRQDQERAGREDDGMEPNEETNNPNRRKN